jgi:hypothetical protein
MARDEFCHFDRKGEIFLDSFAFTRLRLFDFRARIQGSKKISLFVRNDNKGHFAPLRSLETDAATPPR